ncbi:autotransporter outer membrane beta-barrel domain-containing protein [Enterovirga sp.]|uniref:autotransporter outer membrane beta-barrel domain-containing protein n=1 Tax=Enterovirga sp. TaxID=2026350 RepID=UPI002C7DEFCA|nr:autotransporter outer membrane beta-barrel domain-containing protein [Enterovirga sp.]HMO30922.1 autotransporter outer membrane beta-barrel domain-containing protein [Enterovirga sp.]
MAWRFLLPVIAVVSMLWPLDAARAHNIPGSSRAMLAPVTRMAATSQLDLLQSCFTPTGTSGSYIASGALADRPLERNSPELRRTDGYGSVGTTATAGQLQVSGGVTITGAEYGSGPTSSRYDLRTGNFCLSRQFDLSVGALLLGVGANFESGDGKSQYDRGSLSHGGGGGSIFAAYFLGPNTRLFAAAGGTALSFDASRGSGQISGSFGASRWFGMIGASHRFELDRIFLDTTAGLRYVSFNAASYQETGIGYGISAPGLVPAYRFDMLLAQLEGRLGYRFGAVSPYVLAGVSRDFARGATLPAALLDTSLANAGRTIGFAGGGIEALLPGGFVGVEARALTGSQSWNGWQVTGRFGLTF